MDYRRVASGFGLLTAALIVVLIILTFSAGAPPALDDPSQKVLNYYKDNRNAGLIGGFLGFLVLGTVPFFYLAIYSSLRDGLAATEHVWPRLGLTAFIVTGAFVGVQGAAALALTLGARDEFDGAPAVAGALFDLYNGLGAAIAIAFAVLLVATGVALARARTYPNWWSQLLYVGAVASLVSFLAPFTEMDVFAYFGLIPLIVFAIWIASASLALRGAPATPRITNV